LFYERQHNFGSAFPITTTTNTGKVITTQVKGINGSFHHPGGGKKLPALLNQDLGSKIVSASQGTGEFKQQQSTASAGQQDYKFDWDSKESRDE
jgi:hypothetical protein